MPFAPRRSSGAATCLLYTSDAADERSSVDLGGRRIIKKKKRSDHGRRRMSTRQNKTIQKQRHDKSTRAAEGT